MKIYHNPRCSKSRQTLELLEKQGETPEVIRYLDTPPNEAKLKEIVTALGIKPEDLVRKKEQLFKDNFAGKEFSDGEWIKLLAENPRLIVRPIVIKDGKAVIGRPPEKVLDIL
ncbi:arsenate reductase (glutaredoxin) [Fulvitalea axinellae]|uniref:Arsenate reductase (Glutaredoxin) n=1 Tax=Fulvitalea axinellae TaxID=1182444 RepID=A0AAU9CT97_9BACT|nr:arsenate reductase (glutaredoxin) [Fulvitalea axinellae]